MEKGSALGRRGFLAGSLGAATTAALASCSSSIHSGVAMGGDGVTATAKPGSSSIGSVKGTLTFAFWGANDGEKKGFAYVKAAFEKAHPGAHVEFKISPYDGFYSGIDRGVQAGSAPDVFRVEYTTIGKYSSQGVLMDMTPYFTQREIDAFQPTAWGAVSHNGSAYGVPHQFDTSCIAYSKEAFASAGITSVPDSLQDAWTWEEFSKVATTLRKSLPADKYPFAYDWTQAGAMRWSSFLYQAGGRLLTPDLKKSALPSAPAVRAMDFTKSFFDKKWVPANNTVKTSLYADNFFLSHNVAMAFVGNFLVPDLVDPSKGYKGGHWGATYLPRDKAAAAELGGNAIVVLESSKNKELAAAFCRFIVQEDMMKYFCEQATELPTLRSIASKDLKYAGRPDVVEVCAQQATTIDSTVVTESTVPIYAQISTVLQDQLELGFHDQSSDKTLREIAGGINRALGI